MYKKSTKRQTNTLLLALLFMMTAFSGSLKAQLAGTKNIPGDYATLALAIADLNTQGVGVGGVTINLLAGNPQTAPVGGYSITAAGLVADQIIITGNSNTITAPTPQTAGSKVDALFKIVGGDYITIQGFNLVENAANTTTAVATNNMTEFGVAIFAASATNGAQNNTIQSNTITLSNAIAKYQNAIGVFSSSSCSSTGVAQSATSSAGTNSYNKFYGNTISGVFHGMYFLTVTQTASIIESGIDIGGTNPATGNTITFGITNTASDLGFSFYTGGFAGGIFLRNGVDYSIRYNTISNPSTYSITTVGIYANFTSNVLPAGVPVTANMSNNTVTLNHSGNADGTAIDFGTANSNASTHIGNNNTVTINLTHNVANGAGGFFGVRSSCTSSIKTFTSNTVTINETTSGTYTANTSMTGVDANGTTADIQIVSNSITFNQTTSSTASVTGNITGIRAATASTNVTIGSPSNGNTITVKQAKTGSGLYGAGTITYINAAAAHRNLSVTDNVINNTGSSQLSTGTTYAINHNGSIVTSLNVSRNLINIDGGITTGPATLYGIFSGGASAITNYSVLSNTITLNGIGGSTVNGIYNGDGSASAAKTFSLNNITITGNANVVRGIYNNTGKGIITTNTISLSSAATAPTSMTGFEIAGAAPYANEITNNTITSLNLSGLITNAPTVNGILVSSGNGTKIYNSIITNITAGAALSTGSVSIIGISINGGTGVVDFYKNKIYTLLNNCANGSVFGIASSGGATNNIYNNIIGDLQTPYTNLANGVVGINMSAGTTLNVHYNTVYLNATSTGTLFGSSAVSTNGTPTTINLRNNIFVNNSTPTGTAITVAFRRNVATLTNYGAASNNNLFYASVPSASTAIFYDGTTVQQTLADFKTLVGPTIDAASVTENPSFASTVSSNANFLHFNPSTNTSAESGAIPISAVTDDFDTDVRQGNGGYAGTGSSPDIGADEFEGVTSNLVINGIAITPTGNQCTTVSRNVTATITPGAVPITSVTLNYSFNGVAQTPIVMAGGSFTSTSIWNATIPASIPTTANVAWFINATDGTITKISNGAPYKDEPLLGVSVTGSISVNNICAGSSTTLSPKYYNTFPTIYTAPPAVTNPTVNGDLGNVTFGTLDNTSTINSLTGTLGTASGVTGSYSNFTAFGPFNFTAGNTYSMSLSSLQGTTAVNNGFGVYIDYNRNGAFNDAGENVYISSALTLGAHTETVNITIPATANNGMTRMRVINKETSLVTSPTGVVANGEFEEYMLNISSSNNGGGAIIPLLSTYSWFDGTSTVATTSVTVQSPSVNTTYTFTATDANGCSVVSAPVTVTVIPFPSAPVASNASQCGYGVPTASVSGSTSFNWYATPTSTTILQSGSSDTYTSSIGSTTTWYVTSLTGVCENTIRTAVTQSVSIPDLVTPNTSSSNLCVGGANTITLTAVQTGTNANLYTFTWDASPIAGSGMPSTVTGSVTSVTPTLPGVYSYSVTATDGLCTTISTVTISLNNPPAISASASPTVICSGSTVNLNAQSINGITTTTAVGTGATNSTTYPNPFYSLWSNTHNQYLITAAELNAVNILAGNINSLAIDINSGTMTMMDFSIKIGHSGATNMSAFVNNAGFTTVFTAPSVAPVVGLNTLNFSTPFNWDGVSNIVIEICHGNSGSSVTMSSSAKVDNTSYVSTIHTHKSSASAGAITCGDLTTNLSTYSIRPKFLFNAFVGTNVTSSMNWQWNPGSINSNTAIVNPVNTGSVASTEVYTATVTNTLTTCSNTGTVGILVNPIPNSPVVTDNTQCGVGVPTASVSGGTGYKWYATPTSTTVLQSGTSTNYTNSISSTTQWYVSSYDGTCESPRVLLTQTVTVPDQITANTTSSVLCIGGANTATLTTVQTGTNGNVYSFTWNASPVSGSGMPSSMTGTAVIVTPTITGDYTYNLTATDGICTAVSSVSLTVKDTPSIIASATPSMICAGNSINLLLAPATASNVFVGNTSGTAINTTGTPYRTGTTVGNQTRTQYLILASELTAAGISAGNMQSLGFIVSNAPTGVMTNFSIDMAPTAATALTATYLTPAFTNVYSIASYAPVTGVNTHSFSTAFNWDGISNIVINICGTLGTGGSGTTLVTSTTPGGIIATIGNSAATGCTSATGTTLTNQRPRFIIGSQPVSFSNISWSDGAVVGTANPLTQSPASSTNYTVNATANGCAVSATVGVVVNPLPSAPVATDASQCGIGVPTASVSGGISYNWYATPTSTTVLQAGASTNYTTSISSTTTWYVSSINGACESSTRTAVTQTVNAPPVLTLNTPSAICAGSGIGTFSVTSLVGDYSSYVWTPATSLYTDAAATIAYAGSNTSLLYVKSNNAGVITVSVNATNTLTGCANTTTTSITINAGPTSLTVAATPTLLCSGSTATLSVNSNGIGGTIYSENFNGANSWTTINNSTGGTPAASAWTLRTGPYTSNVGTNITSNDASQFYLTDSDAQGNGGTTNTILQSPAINTTGLSSLNLQFFHYYNFWNASDAAKVEVSTDGSAWTQIQNYTTGAVDIGTPTAFATANLNLNAYVGNPTLYVRFNYSASWGYGWAIDNVSLSGNPAYAYSWVSTPAGFTSAVQNPTAMPTGNTDYSVTVTYPATGCAMSGTTSINVNPTPTVTAVASNTAICSGASATFTASGATNYTWSPAGGTAATATVSPSANAIYTVTGSTGGCSATTTLALVVNATPTVSALASSTVICSGGASSTTLTATSTTANYSWTPTGGTAATEVVTPTGNTVYTVTSTNAGCIGSATIGVNVNTTPTVNAVATTTDICSGTTVTLTASGTATNYSWTPTGDVTAVSIVNPTVTTSYVVTGESLGCTATATVNVNVTQTPTVTASASPTAICVGNSAALTAVSSTPDYSWTPAGGTGDIAIVSPAIATIYTVTSTNGACVGTATVGVTIITAPVLTVSPSSSTVCAASSTTLTASGADTYTWSGTGGNAANAVYSPTANATYTVDGTNACGTGSTTVTIDVTSPLTINAITSSTMLCSGETATLTASGTATSYTWAPGGQTTAIIAVTPTTSTIYTVSSSNACGVVTATVNQNVSPCAGIQELESANINVYPNPSTGIVNFDITSELAGNVSLEMYDAIGKLVVKENLAKEHNTLNISKLEEGIYIFKLIRNNGDVKIGRFVKHN